MVVAIASYYLGFKPGKSDKVNENSMDFKVSV